MDLDDLKRYEEAEAIAARAEAVREAAGVPRKAVDELLSDWANAD